MMVVRKKQRGPDGKNVRREADNEAKAVLKMVRISPRKLNLVAQSIRGLRAEKAVNELTFSRKRISDDVLKCLQSAIANAENNHNLDIDSLVVAEAHVGKNLVMKRTSTRARGRSVRIEKPFSQLTIVVRDISMNTTEEAA
jgi:large subunit ribosomal protein L22